MDKLDWSALARELYVRRVAKSWSITTMVGALATSETTYRRVINQGERMQPAFAEGLKRVFGFTEEELIAFQRLAGQTPEADEDPRTVFAKPAESRRVVVPIGTYEAVSLAEIQRRGIDPESILEQVPAIIAEWPQPEPEEEFGDKNYMGSDEQWDEIARETPSTHFYLLEDADRVVAHWSFIPVEDCFYSRILAGDRVNEIAQWTDVACPLSGDNVNLYFTDLFRIERIDEPTVFRYITKSLEEIVREWALHDIVVARISSLLSTPRIIRTGSKIGFKPVKDHPSHTMWDDKGKEVPAQVQELDIKSAMVVSTFIDGLLRRADATTLYRRRLLG